MAKKKKGDAVHGWVILDKPSGITSTQAVATVRRIFNAQKAGHAGTLDPLATGILAIALGEATKTVPYVQDAAKIYRFTATWGEARDTDDAGLEAKRREVEDRLLRRDVADWLARFAEAGVPAAQVRDLRQAIASPQVSHLGLVRDEGEGDRHGGGSLMCRAVSAVRRGRAKPPVNAIVAVVASSRRR